MRPTMSAAPPRLANSTIAQSGKRRPLISLTPLIDVVFILLVFFMLSSSFIHWRSFALHAPAQGAVGSSVVGALLVEIRAEGIRLGDEVISLNGLTQRVAERLETKPDQRVVVKPAPGVFLQEAVQVLDALAAAGAADLSLIRDGRR